MKKVLFCVGCVLLLNTTLISISFSQQNLNYVSAVSSFKTKYPKSDIIGAEIKEEYTFTINTNKNGQTKIVSDETVSEMLVPVKDFLVSTDAVFYDEQSSVENVHASSQKNKNIKFF